MTKIIKLLIVLGVVALVWIFIVPKVAPFLGFGSKDAGLEQAGGAPQALPVSTTIIEKQNIDIWKPYSARLTATKFAQIRPRVAGNIMEIRFKDGQNVKKGAVLFVIDPRGFEASRAEAQAALSSAQNEADLKRTELDRAEKLISSNAISKRIYTERQNALEVSQSRVDAAKASLRQANLSIDYAYVKAPFSGKVGRAEIKEGNLVSTGEPILTTIVATDKIYADFEMDEQTYLSFIRTQSDSKRIPVRLKIGDSDQYFEGIIDSFDNQIDASSGTIRARALLSNDKGILLPGMFASIEIGSAVPREVILVSERAIATNQDRKIVYIVNKERMVEPRVVDIGDSIDGQRIINSGLEVGDMIISEGLIKIRPGMPVIPKSEMAPPPAQPAEAEQPSESQ